MFGVPVYTASTANSAALGAAMRAMHGAKSASGFVPMETLYAMMPPFTLIAEPRAEAHKIYTEMLSNYAALEKRVLTSATSSVSCSTPISTAAATATAAAAGPPPSSSSSSMPSRSASLSSPSIASAESVGLLATQAAQQRMRAWLDATYEVIAKTVLSRASEGLFTCKLRFEDLVAQARSLSISLSLSLSWQLCVSSSLLQEPANQRRLQKLLATQHLHCEFRSSSDSGVELRLRWGPDLL